jgi:hypothetical protein
MTGHGVPHGTTTLVPASGVAPLDTMLPIPLYLDRPAVAEALADFCAAAAWLVEPPSPPIVSASPARS